MSDPTITAVVVQFYILKWETPVDDVRERRREAPLFAIRPAPVLPR